MRSRTLAFVVLAVLCTAAAGVTAGIAIVGAQHDREISKKAVAAERPQARQILSAGAPFAVFRTVDRERPETYGRIAVAGLANGHPSGRALAGQACDRVAFAAKTGLCLEVAGTKILASVLDDTLQPTKTLTLPGIPSRARISPDGRWGGVTAFIVGHSYAAPGEFSTEASVVDLVSGKRVANLEKDIDVYREGRLVDAIDRNYWGLSFDSDGDTFYATLATGGKTWLIRGSLTARRAETIHENVECPSLSPDGTRIGYKKAVAKNPSRWRFHVLDLATGRETPLAEARSVDDQLAWLDDSRLLYGDGEATWVVNADGSGRPQTFLTGTDSTTVQAALSATP